MTIELSADKERVHIDMSVQDFEMLQQILRCPTHMQSCSWYVHGVSVRQAITFALGADETAKSKH